MSRSDKTSVAAIIASRAFKDDMDRGVGAFLHEARPSYGDAIRHMRYIRRRALHEARLRRNGQIFKFWGNRDFVPLFGAELAVAAVPPKF